MLKRGLRRAKESAKRAFRSNTPNTSSINPTPAPVPSSTTPGTSSTTSPPQNAPLLNPPPVGPLFNPNSNQNLHPVTPVPGQIAPPVAGRTPGQTNWAGLRTLADVLNRAANEFGPLKSAVDALSSCIDIFEAKGRNEANYKQLAIEINTLFSDLSAHLNVHMPPAMTPSMLSLANGLQREISIVQQKLQRRRVGQLVESLEDEEDILTCYRRIRGLLERLEMNANVNMWKTLDELATN
ncbi:hypothetical protein FRC07_013161 [Ceratobasidium sp. 392]|nr:hypothetical protein FRC07_013161 [Ceratobasidium sp. 392]